MAIMDGPASPSRSRPQPGRTATHVDTRHGGDLVRLAGFTTVPDGGNSAGVWIGDRFPDDGQMQAIAAEVGYSETVFATPRSGDARTVRYFSPVAEVPFCGHATIALGVALGTGDSDEARYRLTTRSGDVRPARRRSGVRAGRRAAVGRAVTRRAATGAVGPSRARAARVARRRTRRSAATTTTGLCYGSAAKTRR